MSESNSEMASYTFIQLQQDFLRHCYLFLEQNVLVLVVIYNIAPLFMMNVMTALGRFQQKELTQ